MTAPDPSDPPPPATPLPPRSRVGGWAIAATLAVIAVMVYAIRDVLIPFVFAIAIAFVLEPVVVWLQQRLGGRTAAAVAVYLSLLVLFAAAFYAIITIGVPSLAGVAARAPALARHLLGQIAGSNGLSLFGHTMTPDQIVQLASQSLERLLKGGALVEAVGLTAAGIAGLFLTLVLIAYFLLSGPRLAAGALWLVPPERRRAVEALLPKIIPALRRYLIGVALVVVYAVAVGWIGFAFAFHLTDAVLLALTVGLLELVPVIGPVVAVCVVVIVAFQQHSLWGLITLIGFVVVLRLSIDNVVGPLVLGQAARVHPAVVLFSFVCGAMLFGVIGLVLAVPVAICIKTVLRHYYAEPIAR